MYRRILPITLVFGSFAVFTGLRGQFAAFDYNALKSMIPVVPGTWDNSLSAYMNPAAARFVHGPELIYLHTGAPSRGTAQQGFFTGFRSLGFGVVSRRLLSANVDGQVREVSVHDYRASIAAGTQGFAVGLGTGWSGRGAGKHGWKPDGFWSLGILFRPSRFVSMGLTAVSSRHGIGREGTVDLSIRPTGTERLTLFADADLTGRESPDKTHWSAGAAVQFLTGLKVAGKYMGRERAVAVGLLFSLGGVSAGATGNWDRHGDHSATRTLVRLGAPERSVLNTRLRLDKSYLSLDLHGRLAYQKYRFFDANTITLIGVLRMLHDAADDPGIRGVAVNLCGASLAGELGNLATPSELGWEVRQALLNVRQSGKRVVAFLDESGLNGYYVASAADCIVIDPEGMLALEGFAIGKTYLKGLLDKVGIGVEEMRYFKYKSAAEALARGEMSEADRDQLRAYLEDCYALVRKDIALARRFNELKFDSLVDGKMVFSPVEALHEGLVDTLGRWSDAENIVAKIEKGKKPFIGPGRLAKNLFPPDYWGVDPKIAVVYAVGVCDLETGIQARRLERILRGLEKDGSVKAVVLRADSPGGSALASDLVSEALASCKKAKPVIVSQGNVAGSGGYWISMNGDTIVSGPTTITGSIGVIAMWLWNRDLGDKWGMHTDIVQAGRHADLATGMTLPLIGFRIPNRELTLEEKSRIESLIRGMYGQFVAKVASGRGLKTEDIYPVAEGRIWSGLAARQRRLVDLIGGLDDAVRLAREKAHIAPDRNVEVVEFPEKGLFNPDVFMPKLFGVHPAVEKTNPRMDLWKLITDYPGKPLPLLPPDLYF